MCDDTYEAKCLRNEKMHADVSSENLDRIILGTRWDIHEEELQLSSHRFRDIAKRNASTTLTTTNFKQM